MKPGPRGEGGRHGSADGRTGASLAVPAPAHPHVKGGSAVGLTSSHELRPWLVHQDAGSSTAKQARLQIQRSELCLGSPGGGAAGPQGGPAGLGGLFLGIRPLT